MEVDREDVLEAIFTQSTSLRQALSIGTVALVIGLDSIGFAVALAALMFSGNLAPGFAMGITAVLACCVIVSLTIGTLSQLRTNIAGAQDIGAAVLAVTLTSTVAMLDSASRVPTAFAIIAASTLATGILLFTIGFLKVGRLVRYFPLEVIAGFMAATGFLLLMGGVAIVARVGADFAGMLQIRNTQQLVQLVPAIALALLIFAAMEYFRKPFLLLGLLLGATGLFHAMRAASGHSMTDAAVAGWLPLLPYATGIHFPFPALISQIEWHAVFNAAPTIATVAALSLFAALMNVSALEFATGNDVDVDREMRITGGANMLVAGTGGPPGFSMMVSTLMVEKFGITARGAGACVAAIELVGLIYAAAIAMAVPTFVAGGLILYYGIDLVKDWLIATRKTYSLREWSVVLLIVVISVLYGFLLAILTGLIIATILFAYSYANSPVVRQTTDLASLPSTIEHTPSDAARLLELGRAARIFRLQGFLFFGTSEQVIDLIRKAAKEAAGLKAVIIDFARVSEMDSASANAFKRIVALANRTDITLVFCGMNAELKETLNRVGVTPESCANLTFATDLNTSLEWTETMLLGHSTTEAVALTLAQRYARSPREAASLSLLFAEMQRQDHVRGSSIIKAGQAANEVFFIENGRAIVQRVMADGQVKRLRTMLPGAIVGDVAYSLVGLRTADVTAESQTTTLSISRTQVERLAKSKPDIALLFNSLLTRALAEKVLTANRMTEHVG